MQEIADHQRFVRQVRCLTEGVVFLTGRTQFLFVAPAVDPASLEERGLVVARVPGSADGGEFAFHRHADTESKGAVRSGQHLLETPLHAVEVEGKGEVAVRTSEEGRPLDGDGAAEEEGGFLEFLFEDPETQLVPTCRNTLAEPDPNSGSLGAPTTKTSADRAMSKPNQEPAAPEGSTSFWLSTTIR